MTLAIRPTVEVLRGLEAIAELPIVAEARTDHQAVDGAWERIGVVELEAGIERVPPSVCRVIAQQDFGIESIERYPDGHLEVVVR